MKIRQSSWSASGARFVVTLFNLEGTQHPNPRFSFCKPAQRLRNEEEAQGSERSFRQRAKPGAGNEAERTLRRRRARSSAG